jgi:Flp pilus assembly protein TadG
MALQLLILLVPVIFGLMGFALDLGRLWLIRGEVNQAANAMALAAASQIALGQQQMEAAANQALNETNGNRYNFGGTVIPAGTVSCFASADSASQNDQGANTDCGPGSFVQTSITVDAPLVFWSFLPGGETRTTKVASYAVAGSSAPLCTGCGILPVAVQALDQGETVDWGFVPGALYTFYHSCTGTTPGPIAGTPTPYVILNRVDPAQDESDQMFRQGAQGLTGSTISTPNQCTSAPTTPASCVNIADVEQIPVSGNATPGTCGAGAAPTDVTNLLCGLQTRLSTQAPPLCQTSVTDFGTLSLAYQPDIFPDYVDDPTAYAGNGRRILTVAVVNGLATDITCAAAMTVLGFRQFLLDPAADGSFDPTDAGGRFAALYLGTVAPIAQGWFDRRYAASCPVPITGPGKVVLHQ